MSGLSLGLAANTHADLVFLAPGYVLYLFIRSYNSQEKKESLKEFFILTSIFTFSFFIPYLLGFFIFGPKRFLQVFLGEMSVVNTSQKNRYGSMMPPSLHYNILTNSIKYYFQKGFLLINLLLIGTFFIIIYRKIKKESDPLWLYLPLILVFSYVFLFSFFLNVFPGSWWRYSMHLLPVIIIIITLWYYKIVRQLLGKFALIVFIFLSLTMFLVNPKEVPGKKELLSIYRSIYDILKLDVNPENKILIAPVIIYSADCGFQSDLYFGENAIYMVDLPIKDTYDLKSLKELLKDMNIRYVFLARKLLLQLLEPGYPLPYFKNYRGWLRNEKDPYSLRKDLEIIQAYIRNKGGLLINQNAFGKIYYLTGEQAVQKKTGLIANGSFEYWWKGLPMGEWVLVSGRISRSREEFTQGSSSIRLEPDDKKGTRLKWVFNNPLLLPEGKDKVKVKVRLDAKSAESKRFFVVFNAYVNKKWKKLGSGIIRYTGEGEWVTISEEFTITPGMKFLNFNLWLWAGAREPAFVDNLSIRIED